MIVIGVVIVMGTVVEIVFGLVVIVFLCGLSSSGSSCYVGNWWGQGGGRPPGLYPHLMAQGGGHYPQSFVSIQRQYGGAPPFFCFWGDFAYLICSSSYLL